MLIYPAIDLYEGKAVRLFKGNYDQMTVYSDDPAETAKAFAGSGASRIHVVDLEGAREGTTPNFETVLAVKAASGLFVEIGGGIRTDETVAKYLDAGIDRVILGTAAVNDPDFLRRSVEHYRERIAVGIDVRDGYVAVSGWTELSQYTLEEFVVMMQDEGVKTIICTDISRDGAMRGTNRELYRQLSETLDIDIIASGGVSTVDDVKALAALGIHGAIIGKAYYTGAIDLSEAVAAAEQKGR